MSFVLCVSSSTICAALLPRNDGCAIVLTPCGVKLSAPFPGHVSSSVLRCVSVLCNETAALSPGSRTVHDGASADGYAVASRNNGVEAALTNTPSLVLNCPSVPGTLRAILSSSYDAIACLRPFPRSLPLSSIGLFARPSQSHDAAQNESCVASCSSPYNLGVKCPPSFSRSFGRSRIHPSATPKLTG